MNPSYIRFNNKYLNQKGDVASSPYVWKTYEKANNFLTCWLSSNKGQGHRGEVEVRTVCGDINEDIPEADLEAVVYEELIDDENLLNILKDVEEAEKKLRSYRQSLNLHLRDVDKQILDLQHYVELSENQSAVGGYMLYKKDRELLKIRRNIKDQMNILDETFCGNDSECYRQAVVIKEKLAMRSYMPRSKGEVAQMFDNLYINKLVKQNHNQDSAQMLASAEVLAGCNSSDC